jgi:hypothetical protein
MPLKFEVGQKFPSVPLVDDRGNDFSLADWADGQPSFLAFYRGPW